MTELDLAGGYAAMRTAVAAVPVERDTVTVVGPDATSFLQGQLSQDLEPLAPGTAAWSLVLQPQGKVDALVRVLRLDADSYRLDLDAGHGEALAARLSRFKLRTRAEVSTATVRIWSLRGPEAPATPGLPADAPGLRGVDVEGDLPAGVAAAPPAALEIVRIEAGVPRMGSELTDRTIPAEAGQWLVEATVSFTKGCYTGQELVARIDSRGGNVPRVLRCVVAEPGIEVAAGSSILVAGEEAGTVTSAAVRPDGTTVALAYVKRAVDVPCDDASLGTGGVVAISAVPLVA